MKNVFLFIFIFSLSFLFAENVLAQDSINVKKDSTKLSLTSIDVSSGKGAVTSGLYINANMANDKALVTFTFSENDLELTYLRRLFNDKVLIGPNVGYFFNVPYTSGMLIFSPTKYISTMHWYGVSFGEPEGIIEFTPSFIFGVNSITLSAANFSGTYCVINYMNNMPQHTATIKYRHEINKNFSIYTDVGYDFTNESQLLKLGINWKK